MGTTTKDQSLLGLQLPVPSRLRRQSLVCTGPLGSLLPALQVLHEHPSRRKDAQLQLLASYISNIKFFAELIERHSPDALKACCKYLTHEAWKKGDTLFRKGDVGTKFFIILYGSVGIYVKTSVILETHYEDVRLTQLKSAVELQEVRQLLSGESFGELALITNNTRAATVICKSDCHFAVLEKSDYLRILGKLEQQKLEDVVEFLQSLPLFRGWRKLQIQRVSYYFQPVKYIRKQVVYRCKDPPTHVYIIKSGEFELTQDIAKSMESIKMPVLGNKKLFQKYQVTILGRGEVFGDKEIVECGSSRVYTCTCTSSGTLLVITKDVRCIQDFEKRVLRDDDMAKLKHVHAAKANLRESRIKRLISINSGQSVAQLLSPSGVVHTVPSATTVTREIRASSVVPALQESKSNWKHIMKKVARKRPQKRESLLPQLDKTDPKLASTQSNFSVQAARHLSVDTISINGSMLGSPSGCHLLSEGSSIELSATLDKSPESDPSESIYDLSFSQKAHRTIMRSSAILGLRSGVNYK